MAHLLKAQPPRQAIRQAAANGDVEEVCALLDDFAQHNPADLEALAELQHIALQIAAEAGQLGVMRAAIARGADINGGSRFFCPRSPLEYAIKESREEAVQLLLEQGAAVRSYDNWFGGSALSCAASLRKEQFCRLLLSRQDVFVGRAELCAAAEAGEVDILMLLLGSEAKMHPGLRQDSQKRAECMGAAVSKAMYRCCICRWIFSYTPSYARVLEALLAPPAFWGPITPAILAEGVRGAVQGLGEDRGLTSSCCTDETLTAIEMLAKAGADLGVDQGALLKVAAKKYMQVVKAVIRLSPHVAVVHGSATLESNWTPGLAVELLKGGVPLARDPGMREKLQRSALAEESDELLNLIVP
jgi:hypothetical protein